MNQHEQQRQQQEYKRFFWKRTQKQSLSAIMSKKMSGVIKISLRLNLTRIVATLNLNMMHKLTDDGNVPRKKQNRTNRKRTSTSSSKQNMGMVFNRVQFHRVTQMVTIQRQWHQLRSYY